MKKVLGSVAVILLGMIGVAHAQPAPGIAYIRFVSGQVSTQRAGSTEWVVADANTSVTIGDTVSTAGNSRAEIRLDFANVLRLDQNAMAKIVDLTPNLFQIRLVQGMVNYDILRANGPHVQIDTPNMTVHPVRDGTYRIEVISDSQTRVIVRAGEAQISTAQGSTNVEAGQLITIEGADSPLYQTTSAPPEDDWDTWNANRDHVVASPPNLIFYPGPVFMGFGAPYPYYGPLFGPPVPFGVGGGYWRYGQFYSRRLGRR